ncbi:MAG: 4'-phosphopantetheinyl transferase superfamily protein [Hungatella sp.]|nr:4'-phosphopantetheinyl transferase superfamily protein [Hungatella sp.]
MKVFDELIQSGWIFPVKDHIILADLKLCTAENSFWEGFISAHDKARLKAIRTERSYRRVLLRLALVRIILGYYLDFPADKICFKKNKYGKPGIINPVVNSNFNISHSGDDIIVIFDFDREVGIDIENSSSFNKRNVYLLKGLYSGGELERYHALAKQDQFEFFCRTWVVKEAILKALGVGLTVKLSCLELPELDNDKVIKFSLTICRKNMQIQFIRHADKYIGIAYCEERAGKCLI